MTKNSDVLRHVALAALLFAGAVFVGWNAVHSVAQYRREVAVLRHTRDNALETLKAHCGGQTAGTVGYVGAACDQARAHAETRIEAQAVENVLEHMFAHYSVFSTLSGLPGVGPDGAIRANVIRAAKWFIPWWLPLSIVLLACVATATGRTAAGVARAVKEARRPRPAIDTENPVRVSLAPAGYHDAVPYRRDKPGVGDGVPAWADHL